MRRFWPLVPWVVGLNKSTKNRKWLDYWHLRNRRYFAPLTTFAIMWTYLGIWVVQGDLVFAEGPSGANRLVSVWATGGPSSDTSGSGRIEPEATPQVELCNVFGKTPVLRIAYPWKAYSRASVELRFFGSSEEDDERIRPLFFRTRYWNGKLLQTGYECLVAASDVPIYRHISSHGWDWHLLADRSPIGRPGLCIVREIPADPRVRTGPALAVVYPLLEHWAEDETHLWLELPGRYYPHPGQLRIWFLRDNRVVWTRKFAWPGVKEPSAASPRPQNPSAPPSQPQPKSAATSAPMEKLEADRSVL